MILSELLGIDINEGDITVQGLCADSRRIKAGDVYFALKGETVDGRKFISQALQAGAIAIIQEDSAMGIQIKEIAENQIPVVSHPNLRINLGKIAAKFYGSPSEKMTVVGITGTNGKTTCSQYLAQALTMANQRCCIIGTLGIGFPEQLQLGIHDTPGTTPDPIDCQEKMAGLLEQGAKAVAIEVSSHGLEQGRVNGVKFDIAVFTNLSRDHLDYHGDMENYARAKRKLFEEFDVKTAVINLDDTFGFSLAESLKDRMQVFGYSLEGKEIPGVTTLTAKQIKLNNRGLGAKVITPWGEGTLRSQLLGRFNVSNLLAVLCVLGVMKISLAECLDYLAKLPTVPGRMQAFGGGHKPLVVVDYAHTPAALEQALGALREHCHGRLWCVFGCGGDRDQGKRVEMGKIAERLSDQIVITDDNPRSEDPHKIALDIIAGFVCPWAVEVEHDRGAAIAHAIDCARSEDVVLIAGKGHEPYQIVGEKRIPFDDAVVVQAQLM